MGASEGFLGWIAYLGAANAGIPLSIIVKNYGWEVRLPRRQDLEHGNCRSSVAVCASSIARSCARCSPCASLCVHAVALVCIIDAGQGVVEAQSRHVSGQGG